MKVKKTIKAKKTLKKQLKTDTKELNIIEGIYNRMIFNNDKWLSEFNVIITKHFDIKKSHYWKVPLKSVSSFGAKVCKMEQFWILFVTKIIKLKDNANLSNVIDVFTHAFSSVDEDNESLLKSFYLKSIKQYSYSELTKYHRDRKNSANFNDENSSIASNVIEQSKKANDEEDIQLYDPIPNTFCFKLIGIDVIDDKKSKRSKLSKANETSLTIIPEYNQCLKLMTPSYNKISNAEIKSDGLINSNISNSDVNVKSSDSKGRSNSQDNKNAMNTLSQMIVSQSTIDRQEMFMNNIEKANREPDTGSISSQNFQEEHQLSLTQSLEKLIEHN